jgi:hypothetical protein
VASLVFWGGRLVNLSPEKKSTNPPLTVWRTRIKRSFTVIFVFMQ